MKNGENVVKLVVPEIGISEVDCPTINTRTAKTRRGTASHKTDDNGGRERVILAVKKGQYLLDDHVSSNAGVPFSGLQLSHPSCGDFESLSNAGRR